MTLAHEGYKGLKALSRADFMAGVLFTTLKVDPGDISCVVAFNNY